MNQKIVKYRFLERKIGFFNNKKKVLVGGCFDIFHYGHLQFLKKAKKEGDILIVALESDEFILRNKKRKPIHSQEQRGEILAYLTIVDLVILLPFFSSNKDYNELVIKTKPKVIAVTEGDKNLDKKITQGKLVNAQVKVVSKLIKEFSSQKILRDFL